MSGRHLTLIMPGVVLSGADKDELEQNAGYPYLPALECLLSRARPQASPFLSVEHHIFSLFGLEYPDGDDLPIAAATRYHDKAATHGGWYMRADPVHVQAGINSLIMFGNQSLTISAQESTMLVEELNRHFSADDWQLDALHTHRWYLKPAHPPELCTSPLHHVTGRSVEPFLPAGNDAKQWRGYLNEIQMVLHASEVNQVREQRGEPLINSVWFWGGGELPAGISSSLTGVWSDDALTDGLAIAAGVSSFPVPDTFDTWLMQAPAEGHFLVSTHAAQQAMIEGGYPRWVETLERIEADWGNSILRALKAGELSSASCYPGNGYGYHADDRSVRRWWKRCRPLRAFDS